MRTILATAVLLLLGQPALAQQNPMQGQDPAGSKPAAGSAAQPAPDASASQNQQGEQNPAAASASGCGTTGDKLAQTPVYTTPCPGPLPTPGSGTTR